MLLDILVDECDTEEFLLRTFMLVETMSTGCVKVEADREIHSL